MSRSVTRVSLLILVAGLGVFAVACQKKSETPAPQASTTPVMTPADSARLERGRQAFLGSCAACHGPWGEGDGPLAGRLQTETGALAAQLNDAARLAELGRDEVIRIITEGGEKTHRSNLMPPWGQRLGKDVIADIATFVMALPDQKAGVPRATVEQYLSAPAGTPSEGRKLFVYHCTMCHGPFGKGDGLVVDTLWARNKVRPRNLTDSTYFAGKTDQNLFETVSLGGPYSGHSAVMPGWAVSLTPAEIKDLVSYVREISRTPSKP